MRKKIVVQNKMQKNYIYYRTEEIGKNFDKDFKPDLTPKQMLQLGVFGGLYMSDKPSEFPRDWFVGVKFSTSGTHEASLNYFKINASQPLSVWVKKGWVYKDDPRGWFEWYCRYYMGRRLKDEDKRQIKRWKAMRRHIAQITYNCRKGDESCRRKQRQALLHWAYDSRKM